MVYDYFQAYGPRIIMITVGACDCYYYYRVEVRLLRGKIALSWISTTDMQGNLPNGEKGYPIKRLSGKMLIMETP